MIGKKLTRKEMKGMFSAKDLRKYRDEYCLSQEYMANLLEVNQSTYQRIETGKIKLSISHLEKLTNIFINLSWPFKKSESSSDNELDLMKKIITQLEKKIEELEERMVRKNLKIEELKRLLGSSL